MFDIKGNWIRPALSDRITYLGLGTSINDKCVAVE